MASAAPSASADQRLRARAQALGLRDPVLELELLKVFLCVLDSGSFTAAARSLDRTQSAVSLQIKRLETVAGVQLLHRTRSGLAVTDAGCTLQRYAHELLRLHAEAMAALQPDTLSGRIRIGALDQFATVVLPPLIAAFRAEHPGVRIEVETGVTHLARERLGADLDLLVSIYPHDAAVGGVVLQRDTVVWITATRHSPHRRVPLPVALGIQGGVLRRMATARLQESGRPWHPAYETGNTAALEAAVRQGLAIGVCRRRNITAGLRELRPRDGFAPLGDVLVVLDAPPRMPLPRHVAAFRALLVQSARSGPQDSLMAP
ncbi:LysR family transcriptional regulator [Pseudorhodoferax sp.]|uniref:LysR family transcriptional regulator n=1 Tax=Pseudorhodoferax sp. TaxID=1993553 RepID=UPI0039E4594F